jgi:hypothetical protein
MAKRRGNKSEAIRAALAENPSAMPKEIAAILRERRIKVSTALISQVKHGANGHKASKDDLVAVDHILAVKAFADRLGGLEVARRSIDAYAQLTS